MKHTHDVGCCTALCVVALCKTKQHSDTIVVSSGEQGASTAIQTILICSFTLVERTA